MNHRPAPGTVLSMPFFAGMHLGILTENGTVLHNSRRVGRVAEESLVQFANGERVTLAGYPGRLPPRVVIARARSRIGQPWNLAVFNCEHYVRWAHGLHPTSHQVEKYLTGAAALGILASLAGKVL